MKRIYSYIAIASMLAAASCTVDVTDPGLGEVSGEGLILTISCTDPETRAEKDGEDAYNENRIDKIDYFLYPSSGVDGEASVHGTIEPNVVGRYVTSIAMSASDVEKLFTVPMLPPRLLTFSQPSCQRRTSSRPWLRSGS